MPHAHETMPVLFIGHGSPLNLVLENGFTRSLAKLGRTLPRPKAILVVSAHWLTKGTFVTCEEKPQTIYDFFGFPDELYSLQYPSPGAPAEARLVRECVRGAAVSCGNRGLDHGAWAVLRHMYPDADIPVMEMSLDYTFDERHPKPLSYHYELARELSGLRKQGVLIIGSGNIVHNLGRLDYENIDAAAFDWAAEFDEAVKADLLSRRHDALLRTPDRGPSRLAVPTLDHYLPLIYAIALQKKDEPLTFIHEGFQYGSVSMRCFRIG